MAASVRVEDEAFSDERYADLAELAGLADADHARGKMLKLWRQCTIEGVYTLTERAVQRVLGDRGVEAIVGARLGDRVKDGVRIRGAEGRIEWLDRLRKNGQFGKLGGRPAKNGTQNKTQQGSKIKPQGFESETPPAPAPAPAPADQREGEGSDPPPVLDRHRQIRNEGWRYAGDRFRACRADGIDPATPDNWSANPDLANGDELHRRVNELIQGNNDYDRALAVIKHVVDVREAEAREKSSLRWFVPSQIWKPQQFNPARDRAAPAKPNGTRRRQIPDRPFRISGGTTWFWQDSMKPMTPEEIEQHVLPEDR